MPRGVREGLFGTERKLDLQTQGGHCTFTAWAVSSRFWLPACALKERLQLKLRTYPIFYDYGCCAGETVYYGMFIITSVTNVEAL